jgi:hypothetical protein
VKLDRRIGHLKPSDVNAVEEIIWKWWDFATVYYEIINLVAAEALDGGAQHLRVLYVPAVGHHLDLLFALIHERLEQQVAAGRRQESGQPPRARSSLRRAEPELRVAGRGRGRGRALSICVGGAWLRRRLRATTLSAPRCVRSQPLWALRVPVLLARPNGRRSGGPAQTIRLAMGPVVVVVAAAAAAAAAGVISWAAVGGRATVCRRLVSANMMDVVKCRRVVRLTCSVRRRPQTLQVGC